MVFGHGEHFSAGLDLAEVGPAVAEHGPQALAGDYDYDPFGVWKPQVPKPVVLALSGYAYTLLIELALSADIVVAAAGTRFAQLEIALSRASCLSAAPPSARLPRWAGAMR